MVLYDANKTSPAAMVEIVAKHESKLKAKIVPAPKGEI